MISINDYILYNKRNVNNLYWIWLVILFFIIIVFLFINFNFKYYEYYSFKGEVKDNYIDIYVENSKIKKIIENENIKIEKEMFAYKVIEVSKENIFDNGLYYKLVKLSIDKKDILEGETFDLKIITDSSSLIEYLFKTIWR